MFYDCGKGILRQADDLPQAKKRIVLVLDLFVCVKFRTFYYSQTCYIDVTQ